MPGGEKSVNTLKLLADALEFVRDAYRHCKAVAFSGDGSQLLAAAGLNLLATAQPIGSDPGVVLSEKGDLKKFSQRFITAIAAHRNWAREAPSPA